MKCGLRIVWVHFYPVAVGSGPARTRFRDKITRFRKEPKKTTRNRPRAVCPSTFVALVHVVCRCDAVEVVTRYLISIAWPVSDKTPCPAIVVGLCAYRRSPFVLLVIFLVFACDFNLVAYFVISPLIYATHFCFYLM